MRCHSELKCKRMVTTTTLCTQSTNIFHSMALIEMECCNLVSCVFFFPAHTVQHLWLWGACHLIWCEQRAKLKQYNYDFILLRFDCVGGSNANGITRNNDAVEKLLFNIAQLQYSANGWLFLKNHIENAFKVLFNWLKSIACIYLLFFLFLLQLPIEIQSIANANAQTMRQCLYLCD